MSVIVKGIDKRPVSCFKCPLMTGSDECILLDSDVNFAYDDVDLAQTSLCPIIGELPEKHGRLIDADAFIEELDRNFKEGAKNDSKRDDYIKEMAKGLHEVFIAEIKAREAVIEAEEIH